MADSTLAGTIGAIAGVLTALGLLISSLSLFLPILRQVRKVHVIVNQQRTDMLRYQRVLKRVLEQHGIDIPEDQSVDPPET